MPYPLRAKEGLKFQVKQFVKNIWKKFDEVTGKYLVSDNFQQGYSTLYIFDLVDGQQLELSRANWQQALVAAFDEKKHWKDCQFYIKTNGKTGKEVRYFVNISRDVGRTANFSQKTEELPPEW